MAYAIMRISKIKSASTFAAIERHNNERDRLKHRMHPEFSSYNRTFTSPAYSLEDSLHDRFKKRTSDIKIRKNAVLAYEVVMAYSPEAKNSINHDAWLKSNLKWLSEAFLSKDNIIQVAYHVDESTPHLHAVVVPIDEKGRLNARNFTGGKAALSHLQDTYAAEMEKFGLIRGNCYLENPDKPSRKYVPVSRYWVNKEREIENLQPIVEDIQR